MTTDLTVPLLVVGNHSPGSGVGCVMNLMCWEQGRWVNGQDNRPYTPTDFPEGYDGHVRATLITLNDRMCHRTTRVNKNWLLRLKRWDTDSPVQLCPDCSSMLIDLAHLLQNSFLLPTVSALYIAIDQLKNELMLHHCDREASRVARRLAVNRFTNRYTEICKTYGRPIEETDQLKTFAAYQLMTAGK